MKQQFEIRALYDESTITVYQAYSREIAVQAAVSNKFMPPFSMNRMTWIKPSFLWMMERSNWGKKPNQEITLAIKIKRDCFEAALAEAVITSPSMRVYHDEQEWKRLFETARVYIQWDPERDIWGNKLEYRSIQIGISRYLIQEFNEAWIAEINDISQTVNQISRIVQNVNVEQAASLLPVEKVYPLPSDIAAKIGLS